MTVKNGGVLADPVVSAVLNAVGKRYLVEHTEAKDRSWWYDLYSDGWLVQGGQKTCTGNTTLPKEFSTANYSIIVQRTQSGDDNQPYARPYTTTLFYCRAKAYRYGETDVNVQWIAQGYAA